MLSSPLSRNLHCEYNAIIMSPENNAYVQVRGGQQGEHRQISTYLHLQHCLGPGVPSVHLISLPDNRCLLTLDTNQHIHQQVGSQQYLATRRCLIKFGNHTMFLPSTVPVARCRCPRCRGR